VAAVTGPVPRQECRGRCTVRHPAPHSAAKS